MKQFGHRHQSLRQAHRGVLGRGGWQQRRIPVDFQSVGVGPIRRTPCEFTGTLFSTSSPHDEGVGRGPRREFPEFFPRPTPLNLIVPPFASPEAKGGNYNSKSSTVEADETVYGSSSPLPSPPPDGGEGVSQVAAVGSTPRARYAPANAARRARLARLAERYAWMRVLLHMIAFARSRRNFRWHLNCIGHEFYDRRRRK